MSFTPTPWDRAPQQPWPLSDLGQLFVANRGVVQNLALKGTFSGRPFTDANARGASGTTVGMRLNSAVTDTSSVIANANAGWLNGATSATFVAHFLPRAVPSGTTEERLLGRWASGNNQFLFTMRGPEVGLAIRAPSGGNIQARQTSGSGLTAGRLYTVVVTWNGTDGVGGHKFWLNGRRITNASDGTWVVQGNASSIGTVTADVNFGCDPGGGQKATDVLLSGVAIMPLDIGDARAEALSQNFWQLYRPAQRIWPALVVGGGAFTLTADSGTYSLTGQDAGLIAARRVVADQGSYAVTGQTANLIRAVRLLADQGSYSLAGQDVALRAARLIGADSGSYSITGQAANLVYAASGAYTLTADSGTYSISGQDAALTYVPLVNYTLTADAGSYAISGQPATLTYAPLNAYVLTADAGSYSIAGQDAALRYSGAPAGGGFPGFDVRTVDGPRMWWQRKPKKITEEEAEEKLEEVAEVIAKKAEAHAKTKKPKKARTAEVVEEIRPILAEMPGFDWRPMYEAAYQAALDDELDRALRALDVQQMAAQELERIRRIQDDEDVLLIAAMM